MTGKTPASTGTITVDFFIKKTTLFTCAYKLDVKFSARLDSKYSECCCVILILMLFVARDCTGQFYAQALSFLMCKDYEDIHR